MAHKPKAVKYKVIAGYLLLFAFAVISVWFVYTEILKAALPGRAGNDNSKIIEVSNTIADLYSSEALGRTAILTGAPEDHVRYNIVIDSINNKIELLKKDAELSQIPKFDSIKLLLNRKKKSVADIIEYRSSNTSEQAFTQAIDRIYSVKDSIKKRVKPVKALRSEKSYSWRKIINTLLTPKQMDSLSKLPVSNDSLSMAFDKVLTKLLIKNNKLKYELYLKEQNLLEENRIISDQLRVILSSVEKEILHKSYLKIAKSEAAIGETIKTIAWIGAIAFLLLIIFAWIIISDLTSNQNYRKLLERLNVENEGLLRSKTMLMATVTHDLQTPLGSIIGFSDLMDNSGISDKQKQYITNIKESADYILKLVNDLMDFSKLENNRITIEEVSFNLKTFIESTCKTMEHIALNKHIELTWDIDEELNRNFKSDPYRLKQVLINLISNATKFTQEGSVQVAAGIIDNTIQIAVLDTGIGIAHEKQEDVFKEFTQAHTGIEKKFGGTGLGLTISKRMIELLGGTLTLESEEGQGSIFTINLPCKPCEKNEVELNSLQSTDYSFLKEKSILVIDDDNNQLALLREIFNGYGANVVTEINSTAVSSLLNTAQFDLIITDIQMPVMDGFEIIKIIRSATTSLYYATPVIALSGRKDISPEYFIECGFTAYHPKPIELQKLILTIATIFGEDVKEVHDTSSKTGSALFSLRSLSQFTHNDPESLNLIVNTFIVSAYDNCKMLQEALNAKDEKMVAETAHRMIPMLKQMEVYSIVKLLDPLEDEGFDGNWNVIHLQIEAICSQIEILTGRLKEEVA
jgi:signal transduction histidine kinase/CheY-like chemotaxis protein